MKDHFTYIIECRHEPCRGSYELLTVKLMTVDDKDIVRRARCPRCSGPVKVIEIGETGAWRELRGRARSAAVGMGGLR